MGPTSIVDKKPAIMSGLYDLRLDPEQLASVQGEQVVCHRSLVTIYSLALPSRHLPFLYALLPQPPRLYAS